MARAKRRRGKNGGSKAAPSIAVLPAVSALAPASEEPIEVRWTDGPQPVEDSPDDGLDSWQLVIEAKAAYPPELIAMLPSIDQEADHFRRAGALRLWTQAVCENGTEQQIIAAGRAIARWPEGRPGRAETREALVTALRSLRSKHVPASAEVNW